MTVTGGKLLQRAAGSIAKRGTYEYRRYRTDFVVTAGSVYI